MHVDLAMRTLASPTGSQPGGAGQQSPGSCATLYPMDRASLSSQHPCCLPAEEGASPAGCPLDCCVQAGSVQLLQMPEGETPACFPEGNLGPLRPVSPGLPACPAHLQGAGAAEILYPYSTLPPHCTQDAVHVTQVRTHNTLNDGETRSVRKVFSLSSGWEPFTLSLGVQGCSISRPPPHIWSLRVITASLSPGQPL